MQILLLLLLILIIPNKAYAFLSPSTLILITTGLGSFIWGTLAVISVNLFLFFKSKRKLKLGIIAVILSVLTIMAFAFYKRHVSLRVLKDIYGDVSLLTDNNSILKYEIDLRMEKPHKLANYKIFQFEEQTDQLLIKNIVETEREIIGIRKEVIFASDVSKSIENIKKFVEKYNITKSDKLLFSCDKGVRSRIAVILFRIAGYDAYFTRFDVTGKIWRVIIDHFVFHLYGFIFLLSLK